MCPLSSCVGSRLPSKPHPPKRNTWSFVLCLLSFSAASLLSIVLPCGFETSFGTSPTEAEHLVLCLLSFSAASQLSIVLPCGFETSFETSPTEAEHLVLGPLSFVFCLLSFSAAILLSLVFQTSKLKERRSGLNILKS